MLGYEKLWEQVKPVQERDIRESYKQLESLVSSDDASSDEKFIALAKGILLRFTETNDFCKGLQRCLEMNSEKFYQKKGVHGVRGYIMGYVHTAVAISLPTEESKSFTETFAR